MRIYLQKLYLLVIVQFVFSVTAFETIDVKRETYRRMIIGIGECCQLVEEYVPEYQKNELYQIYAQFLKDLESVDCKARLDPSIQKSQENLKLFSQVPDALLLHSKVLDNIIDNKKWDDFVEYMMLHYKNVLQEAGVCFLPRQYQDDKEKIKDFFIANKKFSTKDPILYRSFICASFLLSQYRNDLLDKKFTQYLSFENI